MAAREADLVGPGRSETLLCGLLRHAELATDLRPGHAVLALGLDGSHGEIVEFELQRPDAGDQFGRIVGLKLLEVPPNRQDRILNAGHIFTHRQAALTVSSHCETLDHHPRKEHCR